MCAVGNCVPRCADRLRQHGANADQRDVIRNLVRNLVRNVSCNLIRNLVRNLIRSFIRKVSRNVIDNIGRCSIGTTIHNRPARVRGFFARHRARA